MPSRSDLREEKDVSIREAMAQTSALAERLKSSVDDLVTALERHVDVVLSASKKEA